MSNEEKEYIDKNSLIAFLDNFRYVEDEMKIENINLEWLITIIEDKYRFPVVNPDEIYKKGYHNGFFATHDVPPTVEPTYISDMPDDKVKDLQELAIDYGEGIAVFERKRPQGEWIDIGETKACNFCSICKQFVLSTHYNFCPNCGADMRGEEK